VGAVKAAARLGVLVIAAGAALSIGGQTVAPQIMLVRDDVAGARA
jgi:hypothetical protein